MNISLTPELEKIVQTKVSSGHYNNASEVIRDALRLMIKEDAKAMSYDDWVRQEVLKGIASADRGELEPHDMEDIIQRSLERHRKSKNK
jgi:antitoxin ParD1/3/4